MKKSESIKNIGLALCKFQATIGKVSKEANNPFFKSKYASLANILDTIQKPLSDCGLAFAQLPDDDGHQDDARRHGLHQAKLAALAHSRRPVVRAAVRGAAQAGRLRRLLTQAHLLHSGGQIDRGLRARPRNRCPAGARHAWALN